MNAGIDFSAVIVTHNSACELERLLTSIEHCFDPLPQIIVVDSGSSDDSLTVARNHDAEPIDLTSNLGFGTASNAGLELVKSDVVVLLNPDIELFDDHLLDLVVLARTGRTLIAPALLNEDGSRQRSAHPLPGTLSGLLPALLPPAVLPSSLRTKLEPWRAEAPATVGWAVAACVVAKTALLYKLGPFDPKAFLFYEDLDLCLRARARGIKTEFHPEVSVTHTGSHSTSQAFVGEPVELLARRRREVISQLGRQALRLDDLAQSVTFATRILGKRLLGRSAKRERSQLQALRKARADQVEL